MLIDALALYREKCTSRASNTTVKHVTFISKYILARARRTLYIIYYLEFLRWKYFLEGNGVAIKGNNFR